jgi:hypothetical protein
MEGLHELKREKKVYKQRKGNQNISHSAKEIKILRFSVGFHRLGN